MEEIIGNRETLALLYGAAKSEKPAGCYIIAGAEGSGKRSIARLAAAAFCCVSRHPDGSPCLTCRNCRNILSGTHVDVRELNPEKDKKWIPVEDVRQFLKVTYLAPVEGDWRAYLIDASALNTQGQNALLKSIEEVRPRSVFFLMATDLSALLPTVRSRSVILKTEALSSDIICGALQKEAGNRAKYAERIPVAAALSRGSLGMARKLLHSDRFFSTRATVLSYFDTILSGGGFIKLCAVAPPGAMNRQEYIDFLTMARTCLRDLLRRKNDPGAAPLIFPDEELFSDLATVIHLRRGVELFDLTEELLANADNANVFTGLSRYHRGMQGLTKNE
ncbi:MAG: hypothetical protein J6Z79_06540 [Clostridia bacterium]|nr:hypothetical protein [Clostridia bacterium]